VEGHRYRDTWAVRQASHHQMKQILRLVCVYRLSKAVESQKATEVDIVACSRTSIRAEVSWRPKGQMPVVGQARPSPRPKRLQ